MGNFYGTGIEIWAEFGTVGISCKKIPFGPIMSYFWDQVFQVFVGKNNNNIEFYKKIWLFIG